MPGVIRRTKNRLLFQTAKTSRHFRKTRCLLCISMFPAAFFTRRFVMRQSALSSLQARRRRVFWWGCRVCKFTCKHGIPAKNRCFASACRIDIFKWCITEPLRSETSESVPQETWKYIADISDNTTAAWLPSGKTMIFRQWIKGRKGFGIRRNKTIKRLPYQFMPLNPINLHSRKFHISPEDNCRSFPAAGRPVLVKTAKHPVCLIFYLP